jgi:hypothetical protein
METKTPPNTPTNPAHSSVNIAKAEVEARLRTFFERLRGEFAGFGDPLERPTSYPASTLGPIHPLNTYPDVMIDIEALADTPDSAPAEIALLFFDRDDRHRPFQKFRYEPKPLDAIHLGFNVTPATLKWWDEKGLTIDVNRGEPLHDVLDEITADIHTFGKKGIRVWSRGNAYDLAILRLAFTRTGRPLPWDFWNDRDVRTWLEGSQFKSPRKNDHHAMQDAENQALDVIEATAAIPILRTIAVTRSWNPDGTSTLESCAAPGSKTEHYDESGHVCCVEIIGPDGRKLIYGKPQKTPPTPPQPTTEHHQL